jgi:bifunctional UDP-N-acetylglucosamine pyrophosphorylase/glucosamine-1-phosphate N-acetyltransferase
MSRTWAVILAAGEGKRMRSAEAKVLHRLGGRPLIEFPIALARAVGAAGIVVVVGHRGEAVRAALAGEPGLTFVDQPAQRGTGHALLVARPAVPASAREVLLLYGDVPLLAPATAEGLLAHHRATRAAATVLTFRPADPTGYGRIVRAGGRLRAIVEERDATPAQRRLREANAGVYVFDAAALWPALAAGRPDNAQGELYLTDVIRRLVRGRRRVEAVVVADPLEVAGVNDRRQLAALEAVVRERTLGALMEAGVTVLDPAATYVDATVRVGRDTVLYPGVRLEGRTVIGEGCVVATGSQLTDVTLGDRVTVRPYCVLEACTVAGGARLGPFARLRAGTEVGAGAQIGNFIELKQARVGRGAKAHHVGYLGDATIGEEANIGAGTITCNYDGAQKHETVIGARAFVGTNSSLVAPVTIGPDAYVAAGSVITRDVPPGALAVERAPQVVKEGWRARRRASGGGPSTAAPA